MEPIMKEYCPPPLTEEDKTAHFGDARTVHDTLQQKAEARKAACLLPREDKIRNLEQIYTILCHTADVFGGCVRLVIDPVQTVSYVTYDGGVYACTCDRPQDVALTTAFSLADSFYLYGTENHLFRMLFLSDVFQAT